MWAPEGRATVSNQRESDPGRLSGPGVIAVVPILLVLITFLFWYQTWFGRPLTDREMTQYLTDTSVPHKTQHALSQLAQRIARGDASARRWYPLLAGHAKSRETQFRLMAAWAMGQDNRSEEFHQALRELLGDSELMVRQNAALALARFGDPSADSELRLMLRPYALVAPQAGTISFRMKESDPVRSGAIVARIRAESSGLSFDVRSPLAGQILRRAVNEAAQVTAGQEIATLAPGEEQAWESLRALSLVGRPQDLEDVERFSRGVTGMPARVQQQAALTAEIIRKRAVTSDPSASPPRRARSGR